MLISTLLEDPTIQINHPGYDTGSTTTVYVAVRIAHLFSIDTKTKTYKIAGILQLQWYDPRLDFSRFRVSGFDHLEWSSDTIWTPIVYLRDAVVDDSVSGVEVVQSDSAGLVGVQRLLHMTLMCSTMSFEDYPFDEQSCSMTFVPLRGGADMIKLEFMTPGVTGFEDVSTGEWTDFQISQTTGVEDVWDFNEFVSWPYAKGTFSMKRITFGRLYNMVLPSILFTIMSYSGYYINPAAAPARVTLAMIAVLATIAHRGSVLKLLPAVSYLIWIDTYITINLGFDFIAVITYVAVNFGMQRHIAEEMAEHAARKKSDDRLGATDGGAAEPGIDKEDPDVAEEQHRSRRRRKTRYCKLRLSDLRHADRVMRVLVPIAYAIANVLMAMPFM
jgi:hypothetical protein